MVDDRVSVHCLSGHLSHCGLSWHVISLPPAKKLMCLEDLRLGGNSGQMTQLLVSAAVQAEDSDIDLVFSLLYPLSRAISIRSMIIFIMIVGYEYNTRLSGL
jgi:hypothetical protein